MQHGVLGSYDDGDDTILYMEPSVRPREHPFAAYSNAGRNEPHPWMFFEQTLMTQDSKGNMAPQVFELEVLMLHDDEFVRTDDADDAAPMLVRLKGRLAHYRFGRCRNHVIVQTPERGPLGLYFPMGFADERVNWIAENTTGAWSFRVIQPETGNQRFALEFSFSSERDAVLFKTWWCG